MKLSFPFTTEQIIAQLIKEIELNYGPYPLIAVLIYAIFKHITFVFLTRGSPLLSYFCFDFYYFFFGPEKSSLINLIYSLFYVPVIWYSLIFFGHGDASYLRSCLKATYEVYFINTLEPSLMHWRFFVEFLIRPITAAGILHRWHPVIFFLFKYNLLFASNLTLIELAFALVFLIFNIFVHQYLTRRIIVIYCTLLSHVILYDVLIRIPLAQLTRSLTRRRVNVAVGLTSSVAMLKSLEEYGHNLGHLYCVYAYLIMPVNAVMLIELNRIAHGAPLDVLALQGFACAMTFVGAFVPFYIFACYPIMFHRSYGRFAWTLSRCSARLGLATRWKSVWLLEFLGGPRVGVKYLFFKATVTKTSIVNLMAYYLQLVLISACFLRKL